MGRKSPSLNGWPGFDAPLLRDIADAFARRRKALAYHATLACEQVFAEGPTGVCERLDLSRRSCLGPLLQVTVWANAALWLAMTVRWQGRNAGWAFADRFHGAVLDVGPATLVGMVEATAALRFGAEPTAEREQLRQVWARVTPRNAT
jgi:hypothetical protein